MKTSPEELQRRADAYREHGTLVKAAAALGIKKSALHDSIKRAAEVGMLGTKPVLPGFAIKSIASKEGDAWIKQTKAPGEVFELPAGQVVKGVSALVDGQGREVAKWIKTAADAENQLAAMRAAVEAFKEDIPRAEPVQRTARSHTDLMNFYAVTDAHFGMLAWREETGADYDLVIAEQLLTDWFAAAIELAPAAFTGVLAQMGDLAHYDGMESKTPTSGHILDADSRFPKVVRVIIRTLRRIVRMMLEKHERVHIIMADANHDPASGAWLREMFAAFYDDEPRVTVDSSASTYYVVEHGKTSLFVHHGHRRNVGNVDSVFAGKFREVYGRTQFSYAHIGHLHSDELKTTNLMKVERHETLAAADAYAANGGWLSGRSAKVITYSSRHGEVSRLTLSPEMVDGWSKRAAANDNAPAEQRRVA
ncbi:oxidoreductase [Endobacterium cereale]|uniref:oxidoreductase n=1 Tax=Endobacterium cereale TaxID=2663029 RepID=UPI002B47FB9B|nr:oxidoreductase [Endobacterium cereale]MEB2845951.1 oxidoreductase [Endobacterium cereale]